MSERSRGNPASAPLYESIVAFSQSGPVSFHSPGHKGGRTLPPPYLDRLGALDLNNLPATDTLHCPNGPILEAEQLLASAYGAVQSFLLVNGSSSGNIAAMLAATRPGDKVLVQRNAHKSVIAGLILSGALPVWLPAATDDLFGIAHGLDLDTCRQALQAHPDAVAVAALNPTYYGSCGDIRALRELTCDHGITLLVDEAHGPHFHFHPDLPLAAEDVGADLVVQSAHKVLSALSQGAVLHRCTARIGEWSIRRALQLIQTTSPSFPIMASIDLARREMALHGADILDQLLHLARQARRRLSRIPGIAVLDATHCRGAGSGLFALDETKLVFGAPGLSLSGAALQAQLNDRYRIHPELAGPGFVLCIMTVGSRQEDVDRLVLAVEAIAAGHAVAAREGLPHASASLAAMAHALARQEPGVACSPRQAYFGRCLPLPLEQACGRVAAEVVTPYPPGVPVLMPGERITPDLIAFLLALRDMNMPVSASDPSLRHLLVMVESDE
ncbi:aminotransferase class I/II-fold pyridoxal phosphate-dependent enzyme [Noviherbaspirillum sp. 1P10PC]|uniref:aminotransferase class I/II-fold pyridoxal phosphate-dependent enzyme n=1 Tax=Noviherbaspirillum sp. 1P10PC TaxID=3132292 RepID=UPI0039A0A3F8